MAEIGGCHLYTGEEAAVYANNGYLGVCAVRVLWIIFALPHFHTMLGAAFCYPLTWSLTTIAFIIYYYFFSTMRRVKVKMPRPFGRRQ